MGRASVSTHEVRRSAKRVRRSQRVLRNATARRSPPTLRAVQRLTKATILSSLCNAGPERGFGAAADMEDDDYDYALMPTLEVSIRKQAGQEATGRDAGAFVRRRPSNITFRAATSEWGVYERLNEGTEGISLA